MDMNLRNDSISIRINDTLNSLLNPVMTLETCLLIEKLHSKVYLVVQEQFYQLESQSNLDRRAKLFGFKII
jgi:hypothetical protein